MGDRRTAHEGERIKNKSALLKQRSDRTLSLRCFTLRMTGCKSERGGQHPCRGGRSGTWGSCLPLVREHERRGRYVAETRRYEEWLP